MLPIKFVYFTNPSSGLDRCTHPSNSLYMCANSNVITTLKILTKLNNNNNIQIIHKAGHTRSNFVAGNCFQQQSFLLCDK